MDIPPCTLDELFSFSFDNLKKYIEYIEKKDKAVIREMNDIKIKLREIDSVNRSLVEVNKRIDGISNRLDDINSSLKNHQNKIMEIEGKCLLNEVKTQNLEVASEQTNKKISENKDRITKSEEIIDKLNNLTENNIKDIAKHKTDIANNLFLIEENKKEINNHTNCLNDLFDDINRLPTLEEESKQFREKTQVKFKKRKKEFEENAEVNFQKFSDIESNIDKIFKVLNDSGANNSSKILTIQNSAITSAVATSNQNVERRGSISTALGFDKKEFDSMKKDFVDYKAKLDQISAWKNEVETLGSAVGASSAVTRTTRDLKSSKSLKYLPKVEGGNATSSLQRIVEESEKPEKNPNLGKNQSIFDNEEFESFRSIVQRQIQDNQLQIANLQEFKSSKSDAEIIKQICEDGINKLKKHLNDTLSGIDFKLKSTITKQNFKEALDKKELLKFLNEPDKTEDEGLLSQEIDAVLREKMKLVKDLAGKQKSADQEIKKLYESVVIIRNDILNLRDPNSNPQIIKSNERFKYLEDDLKKLSEDFEKQTMKLFGQEHIDMKKELAPYTNVYACVKNNMDKVKIVAEHINKIQNRVENINIDIINKVKKDINADSKVILDEFKKDLKASIRKIEEQLRDKVDRFNLDEFGKKVDGKILSEMGKKLDRSDLKKNNTRINKKIDVIENKISKTLVDTLIELQYEEVPLLIKQNAGGVNKCGSCNQYVNNNAVISSHNFYNHDYDNSIRAKSMANLHERAKTPNVLHKPPVITSSSIAMPFPNVHVQKSYNGGSKPTGNEGGD